VSYFTTREKIQDPLFAALHALGFIRRIEPIACDEMVLLIVILTFGIGFALNRWFDTR
jgi:hypothetical protein